MDTVTHALIGAAISDGCFRKRLGPVATPFALLVSSLPDIDVVTYFISPLTAWTQHRGYSHSFFIFLLAAPVLGYCGYRIAGKMATWWWWTLLAFLCLVSHTIGDLITSWGTMPLLPFSNARLSWDIVPILDLFLTVVSAASFVVNRLLRWERVDTFLNPLAFPVVHRHPGRQRAATIVGRVCLALLAVYLLVGWRQNRQAVRQAATELAAAGVSAAEVRALPLLLTYISYGIAARDGEGAVYNAFYSSYAPKPMRFDRYPTAGGPEVDVALASPEGRMFSWYSQGMFVADVSLEPDAGETVVRLRDRRFFSPSRPELSRFVMEVREDSHGAIVSAVSRQIGLEGMDIGGELQRLWHLTRYGDVDDGGSAMAENNR